MSGEQTVQTSDQSFYKGDGSLYIGSSGWRQALKDRANHNFNNNNNNN